MKPSPQPAKNSWIIVLIIVGFSFATGYLIGFLAKDVAFTDHESALHEAAGVAMDKGDKEASSSLPATVGGSILPKGKKWAGAAPCAPTQPLAHYCHVCDMLTGQLRGPAALASRTHPTVIIISLTDPWARQCPCLPACEPAYEL